MKIEFFLILFCLCCFCQGQIIIKRKDQNEKNISHQTFIQNNLMTNKYKERTKKLIGITSNVLAPNQIGKSALIQTKIFKIKQSSMPLVLSKPTKTNIIVP